MRICLICSGSMLGGGAKPPLTVVKLPEGPAAE